MTALTLAPPRTASRLLPVGAALLTFGCLAMAVFDFFFTISTDDFASTADYLYTLDAFPLLAGMLLLVAGLRRLNGGRDGLLGRIGFLVTAAGLVAVAVCVASSIITTSENSLGPVYVLGSLASLLGVVLFAIGSVRARVFAWWIAPLLAITWIIGGTVGDNGPFGFPGSGLLLAVAGIATAIFAPRAGRAAQPAN